MEDRRNEGGDLSTWLSAQELFSFSATYSANLEHESVSLVNVLPSSQAFVDNTLLKGPIMRQDVIVVSESQRHFIFKFEQKCLSSTFIFESDQVGFID